MTAIFALVRKDLILFFSNRRALFFAIAVPIILGSFLGYVFGGSGKGQSSRIDVGLVVEDASASGAKIATALRNDPNLRIKEVPLDEAKELVKKGKVAVAVQIPEGFGEQAGSALFGAQAKPVLPVFYDPSQNAVLAMVKGILTQHVMQIVSAEMFSGDAGQKMVDKTLKDIEESGKKSAELNELQDFLGSLHKFQAKAKTSASGTASGGGGLSMPFETHDEEMSSGTKFNGFGHSFTGMGVQFILMLSIDFGVGILLAQQMGMWNRLLAAPITMTQVLTARLLSAAVICFTVYCAIFAFAMLVFKVEIANPLGFLGIGVALALMTAAFGICIAAFGKTPEAARGIAIFATLIMVMLGGAWVPSFLFPAWVQSVTLFIPTRWAIDGISAMTWRALGYDVALQSMGVLLAFATAFAVSGFWKFARDAKNR